MKIKLAILVSLSTFVNNIMPVLLKKIQGIDIIGCFLRCFFEAFIQAVLGGIGL